jgi:hypothetical protein
VAGGSLWITRYGSDDQSDRGGDGDEDREESEGARSEGSACFEVKDANGWQPDPASFDVVWIMEGSEHFPDKKHFFERCVVALKPGLSVAKKTRGYEAGTMHGDATAL